MLFKSGPWFGHKRVHSRVFGWQGRPSVLPERFYHSPMNMFIRKKASIKIILYSAQYVRRDNVEITLKIKFGSKFLRNPILDPRYQRPAKVAKIELLNVGDPVTFKKPPIQNCDWEPKWMSLQFENTPLKTRNVFPPICEDRN